MRCRKLTTVTEGRYGGSAQLRYFTVTVTLQDAAVLKSAPLPLFDAMLVRRF